MRLITLLTLFGAALLCAQQPAFDVASIRPSAGGGSFGPPWKENVQATPSSVTMRGATLKDCMRWAYRVRDFQITGPSWINSQRFDIVAKSGEAVPPEELRKMMQSLLAERFKLEFHRETKVSPAYIVSVAKGGLKLHESTSEGDMMIDPQKAKMQVVVARAGASELTTILSAVLRAPVLDETGMTGKYDVTIDVSKYMPERKEGGQGTEAPFDPVAIITRGLQEEMGLKLESKKVPVEWLIVDHAEKVPIEN